MPSVTGTRTSSLTSLTGTQVSVQNDLLPIVDVSDTSEAQTGKTKKITVGELAGSIGIINLRSYGADPLGVLDSTAAIQSAITDVCATGGKLIWPFGNYKISSALEIPVDTNYWIFDGQNSTITQATNNTPIFKFSFTTGAQLVHDICIENFRGAWSSNQTSAHTASQVLAFSTTTDNGSGIYSSTFRNLNCLNGYSLFATTNATNVLVIWGSVFDTLRCEATCIGQLGKLKFSNSAGMPKNQFRNLYVRADVMVETAILDLSQQAQLSIEDYEVNNTNNNQMLLLTSCRNSEIGLIKCEGGTYSTDFGSIVGLSGCQATNIKNLELATVTFSPTNAAYAVRITGSAPDMLTRIGAIDVRDCTVSSGRLDCVQSTTGRVNLDDFNFYNNTGTVSLVYPFDASVNLVHVTLHDQNHFTADAGNAAVTLYIKDATNGTNANVVLYNTAITADRAVNLPTANLFPGARYRVIRTAAATGAFNVNVGVGPIKALAVGQWVEVLLELDTSGVFTWREIAFGSV
jgi:hypothetical protein